MGVNPYFIWTIILISNYFTYLGTSTTFTSGKGGVVGHSGSILTPFCCNKIQSKSWSFSSFYCKFEKKKGYMCWKFDKLYYNCTY